MKLRQRLETLEARALPAREPHVDARADAARTADDLERTERLGQRLAPSPTVQHSQVERRKRIDRLREIAALDEQAAAVALAQFRAEARARLKAIIARIPSHESKEAPTEPNTKRRVS